MEWQTFSNIKFIVQLRSNVVENEKYFSKNPKMLATDFHIMNRKIYMGYWKRKSNYQSFGVHVISFP